VYDHLDCFRSLFLAGADPDGTLWGQIRGSLPGFTSFYHVAVKHNARPVYVWLLRALGASLYRRDARGRLACDIVSVDNASSHLIRQFLGNLTIHISADYHHCYHLIICYGSKAAHVKYLQTKRALGECRCPPWLMQSRSGLDLESGVQGSRVCIRITSKI